MFASSSEINSAKHRRQLTSRELKERTTEWLGEKTQDGECLLTHLEKRKSKAVSQKRE
jgi:hypothetical protein